VVNRIAPRDPRNTVATAITARGIESIAFPGFFNLFQSALLDRGDFDAGDEG
jgi:hypothetical protein